MGDWGEKPDKRLINKKLLELDKKIWEENRKIVNNEKKPSNFN